MTKPDTDLLFCLLWTHVIINKITFSEVKATAPLKKKKERGKFLA